MKALVSDQVSVGVSAGNNIFIIEDFPMRKIKVFNHIYKSLLVLCRKDPYQYIYNIISTKVAS